MKEILIEHLEWIAFFGLIALVLNGIAWKRGFFRLPALKVDTQFQFPFKHVAAVFAIYLITSLVISPILAGMLEALALENPQFFPAPGEITEAFPLFSLVLTGAFLFIYCQFQDKNLLRRIWKDRTRPKTEPLSTDFALGVNCWLLSFPAVVAIGQLCDMLIFLFLGLQQYEQVAVRFLKITLVSPAMLIMALVTIVLVAPIIEEFIFRGVLQTWLKRHVGTKAAIMLTALCFALFHFAPSQSAGNFSLAISLFVLACYLGFLYEKQGSLTASIGLHMTFNAVSAFRILFSQ